MYALKLIAFIKAYYEACEDHMETGLQLRQKLSVQ